MVSWAISTLPSLPAKVWAELGIENQKINLKTELFSADGKERFFMNESEEKKSFLSLSKGIGKQLKLKSKGSYKR